MISKTSITEYVRDPGKIEGNALDQLEGLLVVYPYFQTAHMLRLYKLKTTDRLDFTEKLRYSSMFIGDRGILYDLLHSESYAFRRPVPEEERKGTTEVTEKEPGPPVKKERQWELIDDFIREDPRIRPEPAYEEEPEDISEKSVENHEGFMTETLARIYLNQKNYKKAIVIYEKLSLKYPEKSTYFASQIEQIKKRLIDNHL